MILALALLVLGGTLTCPGVWFLTRRTDVQRALCTEYDPTLPLKNMQSGMLGMVLLGAFFIICGLYILYLWHAVQVLR